MMIDLSKLDYYEIETLKELVSDKIESKYRLGERHPQIFSMNEDEINDLMLLKIKLTEYLKTLPEPSAMERLAKRRKKRK